MPLVLAAGGDHYAIAGNDPEALCFYPLAGIEDPAERAWAAEWLETLFDLQGVRVAPAHRAAIHDALQMLASSPSRTLTDLELRLQDETLRQACAPTPCRAISARCSTPAPTASASRPSRSSR